MKARVQKGLTAETKKLVREYVDGYEKEIMRRFIKRRARHCMMMKSIRSARKSLRGTSKRSHSLRKCKTRSCGGIWISF